MTGRLRPARSRRGLRCAHAASLAQSGSSVNGGSTPLRRSAFAQRPDLERVLKGREYAVESLER